MIVSMTRDIESQIKSEKYTVTRMTKTCETLEKRIDENQKKLKMSTQLPHMVANVGEILDIEDDEEEEGRDGSGFNVK